jgi:hypothetical protein
MSKQSPRFIDAGKGACYARTRGLWLFADAFLVALDEEKKAWCVCSYKRTRLAVKMDSAFGSVLKAPAFFDSLRLFSRLRFSFGSFWVLLVAGGVTAIVRFVSVFLCRRKESAFGLA